MSCELSTLRYFHESEKFFHDAVDIFNSAVDIFHSAVLITVFKALLQKTNALIWTLTLSLQNDMGRVGRSLYGLCRSMPRQSLYKNLKHHISNPTSIFKLQTNPTNMPHQSLFWARMKINLRVKELMARMSVFYISKNIYYKSSFITVCIVHVPKLPKQRSNV